MSALHSRILEGDGSQESPFVIHTANYGLSRQIQTEIIDGIYGRNKWTLQGRYYYTSARGNPGNSDLCQHRITVEGQQQSVWFDLYLVTRLANDPEVRASLKNLTDSILKSPEGQQLKEQLQASITKPKKSPSESNSWAFGLAFFGAIGIGVVAHSFLVGVLSYFVLAVILVFGWAKLKELWRR
ncbi:MAG: hypothetical protein QOG67_742 [Verrucomicrobiota bacterium]|jgi:hypothetical protein